MSNNALYIVEEFLRSNDPQARKNALTALAVMDEDAECIRRLGAVALSDGDEGVRRRAFEEVVTLPPAALPHATKVMHAGLGDEETGQAAYAALGRLKGLGKPVPEGIPLSPLSRLRHAWMMNTFLNPARNSVAYRTRAWKPALVGIMVSLAVLWPLYLLRARWDDGTIVILPIGLIVLALMTCFLATQRTTPINLYLDRRVAFFVEILTPMILVLPLSVLFLVLEFMFGPGGNSALGVLTVGLPLMAGVVRAATLLSFGVARRRRLNIAFQVCVAVATVFLLLAAVNYMIWRAYPSASWQPEDAVYKTDPDGPGPEPEREVSRYTPEPVVASEYEVMQSLWVCLLPLAGAAAFAFASIDKLSPPVRPMAGRLGGTFSGITLGLALGLLAATIWFREASPEGLVNINNTFDGLSRAARDPNRRRRPANPPAPADNRPPTSYNR